jgi:hypothetical protein
MLRTAAAALFRKLFNRRRRPAPIEPGIPAPAIAAACQPLERRTLLSLTLSAYGQSVNEGDGSATALTVHAAMPYDPEDPYASASIWVDFGDGIVTAGPTVHGGDDLDLPLSHSYLDDGTYGASVFTGSSDDRQGGAGSTVTVNDVPPTSASAATTSRCAT